MEEGMSALKKLVWIPRLQESIQESEYKLKNAEDEVKHYTESLKNATAYLTDIKLNRKNIFLEFLSDKNQVLASYNTRSKPNFVYEERKAIYYRYNKILIISLTYSEIDNLKNYLWDMEKFLTLSDWHFVAKRLIKRDDLVVINRFLCLNFDQETTGAIIAQDMLIDYVDSRRLIASMTNIIS